MSWPLSCWCWIDTVIHGKANDTESNFGIRSWESSNIWVAQPGLFYIVQPGLFYIVQPGLFYIVQPGFFYIVQPGLFYIFQPGFFYIFQPGLFYIFQPGLFYIFQPGFFSIYSSTWSVFERNWTRYSRVGCRHRRQHITWSSGGIKRHAEDESHQFRQLGEMSVNKINGFDLLCYWKRRAPIAANRSDIPRGFLSPKSK